ALDTPGAVSAVIIGTAVTAGLGGAGLLMMVAFFVLGSAATRLGYARKAARGIAQEKGGARGWRNAWANGGVPAALALLAGMAPSAPWPRAGGGWATTSSTRSTPRSGPASSSCCCGRCREHAGRGLLLGVFVQQAVERRFRLRRRCRRDRRILGFGPGDDVVEARLGRGRRRAPGGGRGIRGGPPPVLAEDDLGGPRDAVLEAPAAL